MTLADLGCMLLTGTFTGWLVGLVVRGRGFGLLGDSIVGGLGAVLGGLLFRLAGIYVESWIGMVFMGAVGGVVLVLLMGWAHRRRLVSEWS